VWLTAARNIKIAVSLFHVTKVTPNRPANTDEKQHASVNRFPRPRVGANVRGYEGYERTPTSTGETACPRKTRSSYSECRRYEATIYTNSRSELPAAISREAILSGAQ